MITGKLDPIQVENYVKDHHEGIISRELWEAVQARFDETLKVVERNKERQKIFANIVLKEPDIKTEELRRMMGISPKETKIIIDALRSSEIARKVNGRWVVDTQKLKEKFDG